MEGGEPTAGQLGGSDDKLELGVIEAVRQFLGERVSVKRNVREQHVHGEDSYPPVLPEAVVFAESAEKVSMLLTFCHAARILAVYAEAIDCIIEPEMRRQQLNPYLRDRGLFFPADPGAEYTIGGMGA